MRHNYSYFQRGAIVHFISNNNSFTQSDIDEFILDVAKKEEKKEPEIIVDNKANLILDEDINEEDQDIKNMFEKYKNKFNNNYYGDFNFKNSNTKKECGVCMDTIESNDIFKVTIPCKHYFCVDCWKE